MDKPKSLVPMDKLYEVLFDGWERDCQRFWIIFSLVSIVNSGLFAFIIAKSSILHASWEYYLLLFSVSLLGAALCIIWYRALTRMAGWMGWWENKLEELEPVYFKAYQQIDGGEYNLPHGFNIFVGRKGAVKDGTSTRKAGKILSLFFLAAWLVVSIISIVGMIWFR
ncbi:MAG: hypothetical protein E3J72_11205 [Planctomycetota bacterium]|nr:MAG: hypothetical protein E3J72_11205 [Planctomycetota bacterium]